MSFDVLFNVFVLFGGEKYPSGEFGIEELPEAIREIFFFIKTKMATILGTLTISLKTQELKALEPNKEK